MTQSRDAEDAPDAHNVDARILGCLAGLATGDAIGKQTETLSREGVLQWYPRGVSGFEGQPGTVIPRYAGNSKRQWLIGETTDDTERTLAVARAILRDRAFTHVTVREELLSCTKCVHPGLQSLWRTIYDDLRRMPRLNAADVASRHFPKDPLTIVPLALTLAILMESAEEAILLAANIGGDSDSVASIAGAILGARYPDTVNDAWFRIVETVNGHNLVAVAESLAVLRV
jgi:ADP-ribosylglycohydrolase